MRITVALLSLSVLLFGVSRLASGPEDERSALEATVEGSAPVAVRLLAFNDFHGALLPPAGGTIERGTETLEAGGVEFMTTHVRRLLAEQPHAVVVAAGDTIGASPLLSALFHDEPTIEAMNNLGLHLAAVGNHEFDEGPEELLRMQHGGCHPVDGCRDGDGFAGAAFSFLAANVIEEATQKPLFPAYEVREFAGIDVAFIGMTLENTPAVTTRRGVDGLQFRDEAETVNALVPELRARGIETVVVLVHEGGLTTGSHEACTGIAGPIVDIVERLDDAVDVVVSGHTHAAYICNIDGKLVTSAASNGRLVTVIDLELDQNTGDVRSKTARQQIVTRIVERAPDQSALLERYQRTAAPLADEVVARFTRTITADRNAAGQSELGSLIADAQLEATSDAGAQVAFMNIGGMRADMVYEHVTGSEAAGELTFAELFTIQPFGNTLVTMTLTGAQIEQLLEAQWRTEDDDKVLQVSSSLRYTWDASRPVGDRVDPKNVSIDGKPLQLEGSYRVTVNDFLAEGGDGFEVLQEGTERTAGGVDVEATKAYLARHSPYAPPASPRIRVLEPPSHAPRDAMR